MRKANGDREVIYAFESPYLKKRKILSELKGRDEVYFFRSGVLVEIRNNIIVERRSGIIETIPKGFYYLNTVSKNGGTKITSMEGNEYRLSISKLMEEGQMRPAQEIRMR